MLFAMTSDESQMGPTTKQRSFSPRRAGSARTGCHDW